VVATPVPTAETTAPRTPGVRRARRRRRRLETRDIIVLSVIVGLTVIIDLALIWGTSIASIFLSFTAYEGIGTPQWVGTANYHNLFTIDPTFWPALQHNVLWLAFLGLVATPLGLLMAVLLDRQLRFSRFYQSALYLPVTLSFAVVGFMVQLVGSSDEGVINAILGRTHGNGIDFVGNPHINIWLALAFAGWRHAGYVMIIYLAGLKSVDPALKEAAIVDGASPVQTFFRVVFPTMRPINVIILVITVIEALRAFDLVYVINGGRNGLELLAVMVVDNIIGEASRIGYGSAVAVILLILTTGFVITYLTQILRREESR
jgi:multiple sugar transport system permease protein